MDNAGDFSATFLPILTPPKYCKDKQDKLNSPIVIAWASRLGRELFYFDELGIISGSIKVIFCEDHKNKQKIIHDRAHNHFVPIIPISATEVMLPNSIIPPGKFMFFTANWEIPEAKFHADALNSLCD